MSWLPVKAFIAAPNAGSAVAAGGSLTVTVNITQGWEVQVPCFARYAANVSLATAVYVFPTSNGGATFDTEPLVSFSISSATASVHKQGTVRLTTGMYAIQIQTSSPSVSIGCLTCEVVTAFITA